MRSTSTRVSIAFAAAAWLSFWTTTAKAVDDAALPSIKDLPVRAAMPDPLTGDDGKKITTPQEWQQRREKIKQVLEFYALGHRPPPPGNVVGHELQSKQLMDGKVSYRLVHLSFGPEMKLGLDVAIFVPAETEKFKAPFPTIMQPSFFPMPGTATVSSGQGPAKAGTPTNPPAKAGTPARRLRPLRRKTRPGSMPSRFAGATPLLPSIINSAARTHPISAPRASSRHTPATTGAIWRPGRGACHAASIICKRRRSPTNRS